jgi:hypothetical protein
MFRWNSRLSVPFHESRLKTTPTPAVVLDLLRRPAISTVLGRRQIFTTDSYIHMMPTIQAEAVNALATSPGR